MSRRRFSERDVLATLLWQGTTVLCFRCKSPFVLNKDSDHYVYNAEREHLHEVKLDGPDMPHNCRYSCKRSHGIVTNGTPAMSAGSSKQRIAKSKPTRMDKFGVHKKNLDEVREPKSRFGWRKRT